jgi:hypothetical protein
LAELGITGVVINRREDNRDITLQVIEQLERADLCIADLTHARPSVYFEAGYAQRKVEVIYTAREDHLERGRDDSARVHFDLEHRSIIPWSRPESAEFRARLKRRIKTTFLGKWLAEGRRIDSLAGARKAFADLAARDRLAFMLRCSRELLKERGFDEAQGRVTNDNMRVSPGPAYYRIRGRRFAAVVAFAPSGSVEGFLRSYIAGAWWPLMAGALVRLNESRSRIAEARTAVLVMSERRVRQEAIARSLVHWRPEHSGARWVDDEQDEPKVRDGVHHHPSRLAIADDLRSGDECGARVAACLDELLKEDRARR